MAKNQAELEEAKKAKEMVEEIASNIAKLARQVSSILDGRLKKSAIVILLAQTTKLPQWNIEKVLDAIVQMEKNHLK